MQILVIGYYGFGNVGDDICLAKTKDILNSLFVSPIVWILSADKYRLIDFTFYDARPIQLDSRWIKRVVYILINRTNIHFSINNDYYIHKI